MKHKGGFNLENFKNFKNQLLAVCVANIATISFGQTFGWLSPALEILESDDTPLVTGPVDAKQVAWFGLSVGAASVVSAILSFFIIKFKGLKFVLCYAACTVVIYWLLIIFGNRVEYIYVCRVITGISGATCFLGIPLFVAEISDADIRGSLGSFLIINQYVGLTLSYIIGSYVPYNIVPFIFLPFPITFLILFIFIPNTPHYFLRKGELSNAEKSLRFYKNCSGNSSYSDQKIKSGMDEISAFIEREKLKPKIELSDLVTPDAKKAFCKAIPLAILYASNGNYVFFTYAASIFRDSGSNFDPKISSIVMGLIQLTGSLLAATLMDRIGRRLLLILSTIGITTGSVSMAIFNYLAISGYNVNVVSWVPILSMGLNLLSASSGMIPVSFVILAEVFPAKIRFLGSMVFLTCLNISITILLTIFPIVADQFHLYTCFIILAVPSCFGIFFSIFVIQDTTGKNLNK